MKVDASLSASPIASSPAPAEPLSGLDLKRRLERIAAHCRAFQSPVLSRSIAQLALSLAIYAALIAGMIASARAGQIWIAALLAAPAAGMLVKLFTIQHDCGHGSYFRSRTANDWVGRAIAVLTFTPYSFWRDAHNRHHASSGNLSKRGVGGIDTLTVDEFNALSPMKKLSYRLYRHPAVMLLVGAPIYFIILQRLPFAGAMPFAETYQTIGGKRVWRSVLGLNAAMLVFYGGLSSAFGPWTVLGVFIPVVTISAWAGAWLFFIQHQYEDAYWARTGEWSYLEAAILGSSHYDLPPFLHWVTGNIGLHHIHHLSSLIPNYRLHECLKTSSDLMALPRLSLLDSLKCARLALWDEAQRRMVPFRALKERCA